MLIMLLKCTTKMSLTDVTKAIHMVALWQSLNLKNDTWTYIDLVYNSFTLQQFE